MSKHDFAQSIADYVAGHERYDRMTKHDAAAAAVMVLLDDIGAAQGFVRQLGIDVDLYSR